MSSVIADASPQQAHQTAIPQRRAALIAGLAYVLLTVLALFAIRVLDGSTQPDNPAATVEHIVNSKALFRSGLPAFFIVLIAAAAMATYNSLNQAANSDSYLLVQAVVCRHRRSRAPEYSRYLETGGRHWL